MAFLDEWTGRVYVGDCLEFMAQLPDGCVVLTLTDPPYCSGAHEAARRAKRPATTPESVRARPVIDSDAMGSLGFEWVTRRWLMHTRRTTQAAGHLACFIDWRMLPPLATLIEAAGWRWNNLVVWDKGYPGLGAGFRAQHELVVLASNGAPEWASYDYGNVLSSTRLTQATHPHEKPEELLAPIIETCTKEGDLIFDPFLGSGTTAVVAERLGRRWIGCEINPEYAAMAEKRIKQERAKLRLPMEEPKQVVQARLL